MPTRVRFVMNKVSGEVEEFLIDDQDRNLPEAEHDRLAAAIGGLIARNPALSVAPPAGPAGAAERAAPRTAGQQEQLPEMPATAARS